MWDVFEAKQHQPETAFFDEWMRKIQSRPEIVRQVRDAVFEAEAVAPEVTTLRTTSQSAPFHAEGPTVIHHLERMLAGLFAIVGGASLLEIEEFAREQVWHPLLRELEETIREQAATLEAFVFIHDLAKASTLSFDSPAGSQGASEGFLKDAALPVTSLNQRYQKLIRAAAHEQMSPQEQARWAYDTYKTRVHYYGHAKVVLEDLYNNAWEALCDLYRLTGRDREMLALLVRSHIDVIHFFNRGVDPAKMSVLERRANKLGLDAEDVIDLQLACLLLDTTFGSLRYEDSRTWIDTDPIIGFIQSEQQGLPHRTHRRLERLEQQDRRVLKAAMEAAGIDAQTLIERLELPIGPKRGEVLHDVARYVRASEHRINPGEYPNDVLQGIIRARALYQSKKSL